MAVSRAAATTSTLASTANPNYPGAPTRVTFAKIHEPLEVPDLLDLQIQPYEWLVGSEA